MPLEGEYEPSTTQWVREQVEAYEESGGTKGATLWDTGWPVVVMTTRGAKTGKIRKAPVMRVECDGRYAVVGSLGGSPRHPLWYFNIKADRLNTFRAFPHPDERVSPVARGWRRSRDPRPRTQVTPGAG
ncbi:nitroreductase/quinone reductase family protein [Streptomyces sp. NPDC001222]|uniref:nitroreductase/quinone reductase family protein n=1 Tax=Streptomyces sp. NPDC001222 TaxID=3364548 RepID=UPI003678483F